MKLYQIIYLLCVIVSIEGSLSKVLLGREIYQNGDKNNSDNDNNSDSSIINDDDDDNDDDNNNDDDDDKEETESPELNLSSENSSENSSETDEENSNESASRLKLSSRRSAVNSALQRRKKTSAEIDSKISKKSSHSQDISENSEDTKMTSGSHEMVRTGNKDEVSRRCFFLLPALIGAATHVASTLIKPFFRPMRRPVYTTTTTTTTEEPTTTTRRYYTSTYSWERPTTSTTTTTTTTTQRPTTTTAATTTTTTTTTTQTPTTTTDMTTAETQTSSLTTAPLLDPTSSSESPSQSESPPQTSEPPDLSTPVTESNSESKQDDSITPDEPTTETTSSTEDVERRRIRRLKKKTISRSIRSVINPLKKINSPYSYTNIHVLKFGRKKPLCPRRCCNRKRNNYKYLNCHKKRIIQWPSTKKFPQNLQTKDGDNNNNHGYRILGNNNHRIKLHHEKIQHNNNYNENKNNIVIPRVKDDCKYCKAGIKHRHDEHNSIDDVVKISKDKLKKKYDNENPYDFIVNHDHPHHSHFINPENIRITQTDKLNMAKIVTEHVMQGLPPDMKNESWAIDLVKRIVQDKLNEDNHDKSDVDLQSNKSDENGKKELGDDVQQDDYYQPSAENQGQHGQAYQQPEYNRPGYYQQQPPYYPPIYPPPPPWYNYPPYRGDYDDDCDDSYQRKRIRALRRDRIESDDSYEENEKSSNAYKYGDSEFVIKVEKEKSCKCLAPINETTRTDYTLVDGVGWMKIVEEGKTWNDARKHCVNEGANLAVIESDKEAKWIADKAPTATSTIYLGIHCHFSRNEWISVLDKSMDKIGFTQWRKGKPEYKGTSEYCGALWKTDVLLTNVECTSKFPFVCKIPIHGPCRTTCN